MKAIVNPFLRKGSFLAACPPSEGVTFPCRLTGIVEQGCASVHRLIACVRLISRCTDLIVQGVGLRPVQAHIGVELRGGRVLLGVVEVIRLPKDVLNVLLLPAQGLGRGATRCGRFAATHCFLICVAVS